jgi:hypothetical protein
LRKIDYVNFVAERASPESITPVFAFGIHTLAQGLWIPGLREVAHPGMTKCVCQRAAIFRTIPQKKKDQLSLAQGGD